MFRNMVACTAVITNRVHCARFVYGGDFLSALLCISFTFIRQHLSDCSN